MRWRRLERWISTWRFWKVEKAEQIYNTMVKYGLLDPFMYLIDKIQWVIDKVAGIISKIRSPKMIREAESELMKADIRKGLSEDLGIEGEGWIDEEVWYGEHPPFEDGREWWMRDNDNPGDR